MEARRMAGAASEKGTLQCAWARGRGGMCYVRNTWESLRTQGRNWIQVVRRDWGGGRWVAAGCDGWHAALPVGRVLGIAMVVVQVGMTSTLSAFQVAFVEGWQGR